MKTNFHPPRHLVWSTDHLDLTDPFQRRWFLQQTLTHGKAEDIRRLNIEDVSNEIDQLKLPKDIERLWRDFLKSRNE
jgi:hypothetical protein